MRHKIQSATAHWGTWMSVSFPQSVEWVMTASTRFSCHYSTLCSSVLLVGDTDSHFFHFHIMSLRRSRLPVVAWPVSRPTKRALNMGASDSQTPSLQLLYDIILILTNHLIAFLLFKKKMGVTQHYFIQVNASHGSPTQAQDLMQTQTHTHTSKEPGGLLCPREVTQEISRSSSHWKCLLYPPHWEGKKRDEKWKNGSNKKIKKTQKKTKLNEDGLFV